MEPRGRHQGRSVRLLPSLALGGPLALGLCLASAARAVIIDSCDGTGNTGAPADDPGWSHVGRRGGLTAIYMGNGWVLTANHVGEGDVVLEGVTYPAVTGSKIRIGEADLAVFQIDPSPGLPILPISAATNLVGAEVTMIGNGRNRGPATSACDPPGPPIDGYEWGAGKSMRWGTNVVDDYDNVFSTEAFYTEFTEGGTGHEAQAATGDSGGAVFVKDEAVWKLAGEMFAIATFGCQPASTALYGNLTYAADLAVYRSQIIAIIRPQCSDEIDNDGDGRIDFPSDPDCSDPSDSSEWPMPVLALSPRRLALLVCLLTAATFWAVRRQRAAST